MTLSAPIECIVFRPGWEQALADFFSDLNATGDTAFFHPHATDEAGLHEIVRAAGNDLYYLFVSGSDVLGYGLLRGWNEGYEIPSLGIAVHPSMRGRGLGRLIIEFLETVAKMRGAPSIRLRVHKDNAIARDMYLRKGYRLTPDGEAGNLLVGIKCLESTAG